MDPQHRHFLECCWEALEHSGHVPETFDGAIGVYGGSGMNAYMIYNLQTNPKLIDSVGLFLVRHTGNDKDFLTTRVSYQFNLKGPSINVQTACSTSLVAIHVACQSLLARECDLALAGGVTIDLPLNRGYLYREGEVLSRDGHCRAFDHRSSGTIFGSGAGVVALRRTEDAIAAGQTIHATIRGSAINNDGALKVGYLAPSVDGQAEAIAEALAVSGVEPESISYIETHGTGTSVGDPIEITALTQAFGTRKKSFCALGSVKTNIGHLDTAAGVAGFIKAVEALKHKTLPPSLNFEAPNPLIDFDNSPFYVNNKRAEWTSNGTPRRAAINSLGVGGTNAHLILEEAPAQTAAPTSRACHLLTLSARSDAALDGARARLAEHLRTHPDASLADVAFTLHKGRRAFQRRACFAVRDSAEAVQILESGDTNRFFRHSAADKQPSIVFLFPGGGAQYAGMGAELYREEKVYRQTVDQCIPLAKPHLQSRLRQILTGSGSEQIDIEAPGIALPALFICEYATARLLMSFGVEPSAMIGHSMGEYTVACLAGVMSVEHALEIVTVRGELFEKLPAGGMISIPLSEDEAAAIVGDRLSIAAVNAPSLCVGSGTLQAIEEAEAALMAKGVESRRLKISVAAHSAMLEPILEEFGKAVAKLRLNPPSSPYISNVTGTWITAAEATDPAYWVKHLRGTVRFSAGVTEVLQNPNRIFIECGPGQTLASLVRQHQAKGVAAILTSLRHPQETVSDVAFLLASLGRVWAAGGSIDFDALYPGEKRRRIPLPTYAFEHQKYWIDPGKALQADASGGSLAKQPQIADWYFRRSWRQQPAPVASDEKRTWLVFADKNVAPELVRRIERAGHDVVQVVAGKEFKKHSERRYSIRVAEEADYSSLISGLESDKKVPQAIVHLWSLMNRTSRITSGNVDAALETGFGSMLHLCKALSRAAIETPIHLAAVSTGMQPVNGEAVSHPEQATLLGPCRVAPRELPNLHCTSIDVQLGPAREAAEQIFNEIAGGSKDRTVAYRGPKRFVEAFERCALDGGGNRLRKGGVYMITGGAGGMGLTIAEHLAKNVQAKLALVSRRELPPKDRWAAILKNRSATERTCRIIEKLMALEELGAEVLVLRADVASKEQMRAAVDETVRTLGPIHGVFHAAGVLDDGVLADKSRDSIRHVLSPKVQGTLVLDEVLHNQKLDFFLMCSSTSSILGPTGQVDYAAANCFMNAFADTKRGGSTYVAAIDWGVWKDVGMAAELSGQTTVHNHAEPDARVHPLLDRCIVEEEADLVYASSLGVASHWVLSEHEVKDGACVLPGSAYPEIVRAALKHDSGVEIEDLTLVSPLTAPKDGPVNVQVAIRKSLGAMRFTISSRFADNQDWQEHAGGTARTGVTFVESALDLRSIESRLGSEALKGPGEFVSYQADYLNFGPRWRCLRSVRFGDGEALAKLELASAFRTDCERYLIHPALFDMATGFAFRLIPGYEAKTELYVPMSFRAIRVHGPLPSVICSYARLKSHQTDLATFDMVFTDEAGKVLLEVEDFANRRIPAPAAFAADLKRLAEPEKKRAAIGDALQEWLNNGITPEEGVQAFDAVLSAAVPSPVVVTSIDLHALMRVVDAAAEPQDEGGVPVQSRGELSSAYAAPSNPVEKKLCEIWQNILGVDKVGTRDSFFDLGGHSLLALRMFAQINKQFGKQFPLATLFEANTVEQLARLIGAEEWETPWKSLVPIQPNGSRPPFYCVHGLGGNIVEFLPLAKRLPDDQPLYGLQARGMDGKQPILTWVPDMAQAYLEEVRRFQPHGPYYLGGSSFGGLVAYEMAQQLRKAGERVALLALFDTYGPGYPKKLPNTTKLRQQMDHLRFRFDLHWSAFLITKPKDWPAFVWERVRQVPRRTKKNTLKIFRAIDKKIRFLMLPKALRIQFELTGDEATRGTSVAIPQTLQDVQAAGLKAAMSYVAEPYEGEITLLRATNQPLGIYPDGTNGWAAVATGGLIIHDIPGHHGAITREPRVKVLADTLMKAVDAASGAPPASAEPAKAASAS
jgi:acyl transferase domain-containing protein/thioesterase domain-containing protein/acyl carrier protein